MKVILLSLNYTPELIGIGPYSAGTAQALADAGHQVHVICGKPYYPQWRVADRYRGGLYHSNVEQNIQVTRCAHYVPSRPTGLKRLIHHISFAITILWPLLRYGVSQRPDVIMATAPSIIAAVAGRVIAYLCGARFWLHVQDFELEAAQATGLLKQGFPAVGLMAACEKHLLKSADVVSSISPKMCQHLAAKGVCAERIIEFPNWADGNCLSPRSRNTKLRKNWHLGERSVALYSGSLGRKQGLAIILEMAKKLRHRNDLVFVICGDGPEKHSLECEAAQLPNCFIKPLQPRENLAELLATADVFLLPQLCEVADLVLPSKLSNMLAAGRPIIATAQEGTGLHSELYEVGIITPPGDAESMADALQGLIDDRRKMEALGLRARAKAKSRWSKAAILAQFQADFVHSIKPSVRSRSLITDPLAYFAMFSLAGMNRLNNETWLSETLA